MISLFSLYEKVCGTYNTHQGGHIRPHRNFVEWVNDISVSLFEEYFAVAEKNQEVRDYLTPFLRSVNVIVKNVPGSNYDVINFPSDYEHYSSSRAFINKQNNKGCLCSDLPIIDGGTGNECENPYQDEDEKILKDRAAIENLSETPIGKIDNQRWGALLQHKTKMPTLANPKLTQYDQGFKIAPKGLSVIVLDYYRRPKLGSFAYTILNPNTIDEYYQFDANNSQSLEWSSILTNEFVNRIGKKYGQFIREDFVFQTSEMDRTTTI